MLKRNWLVLALWASFLSSPAGGVETGPGAWLVEWRFADGMNEMCGLDSPLESLSLFAAYFDGADRPFLAEGLRDGRLGMARDAVNGARLFLTVVNDVMVDGAPSRLKDAGLVERLLASPESRARHLNELFALVDAAGGVDGLELDYERVGKAIWPAYLDFCRELHAACAARGLALRVVLEPKAHCFGQTLPAGPEYVVMAYNLHGPHNNPGPKTDPSFIARLASFRRRHNAAVPMRLALATGGFTWAADGTVTGVEEMAARELAAASGARVDRHAASGYRHFMADGDEGRGETWYADGGTFRILAESAREHGFAGIDIWRLGGNSPETLAALSR